jgi:hypothetical protein
MPYRWVNQNQTYKYEISGRFYPEDQFPQKTLYALEELTTKKGKKR